MNPNQPTDDQPEPQAVRAVHCMALPSLDVDFDWPTAGRKFSLLVDLQGSAPVSATAYGSLALAIVGGGARWVVARGEGAADLEDAIIDELAERGGSLPDGDTVVTRVETGSLSEALWQAYHLFDGDLPPVVVLRIGPQADAQSLENAVSKALRESEA